MCPIQHLPFGQDAKGFERLSWRIASFSLEIRDIGYLKPLDADDVIGDAVVILLRSDVWERNWGEVEITMKFFQWQKNKPNDTYLRWLKEAPEKKWENCSKHFWSGMHYLKQLRKHIQSQLFKKRWVYTWKNCKAIRREGEMSNSRGHRVKLRGEV